MDVFWGYNRECRLSMPSECHQKFIISAFDPILPAFWPPKAMLLFTLKVNNFNPKSNFPQLLSQTSLRSGLYTFSKKNLIWNYIKAERRVLRVWFNEAYYWIIKAIKSDPIRRASQWIIFFSSGFLFAEGAVCKRKVFHASESQISSQKYFFLQTLTTIK